MSDFLFSGTPGLYLADDEFSDQYGDGWRYGTDGSSIYCGSPGGFSQFVSIDIIDGHWYAKLTFNRLVADSDDSIAISIINSSRTGFAAKLGKSILYTNIQTTGGNTGSIIDPVTGLDQPLGENIFELWINQEDGGCRTNYNGEEVATFTFPGSLDFLNAGFAHYRSSLAEIFTVSGFTSEVAASSGIISLASTLRPGNQYDIEYFGIGDIDPASSSFGSKALSDAITASGSGTVDIQEWVHGDDYDDIPGNYDFVADDGSASITVTRAMGYPEDTISEDLQYYSSVVLGADVDTGIDSLGRDPAFIEGCKVFWPYLGGGYISDTGLRVNVPFGEYPNFWMRDNDGIMWTFSVILIETGGGSGGGSGGDDFGTIYLTARGM